MYKALVSVLYALFKDPESIHRLAIFFLKCMGMPIIRHLAAPFFVIRDVALSQTVFGVAFNNPVGLAGGFDKNGEAIRGLETLGFGFIELGTVTKEPQAGNPRPRMFRFADDYALINRMGFNNKGAAIVAASIPKHDARVPLGISLGKSKNVELDEAADDYLLSFKALYEEGDYFAVNVSSPNTPGLRELQDKKFLVDIIKTLNTYRSTQAVRKPLLVKIGPDLSFEAIDEVLKVCAENDVDGIIAVNTTVSRAGVSKRAAETAGGLSGKPLEERASEIIRYIRAKNSLLPIVGVGGIFTAEDAYEKIKAGASLVQIYTGFIYEGPFAVRNINSGLLRLLRQDGYKSIAEAVGKG